MKITKKTAWRIAMAFLVPQLLFVVMVMLSTISCTHTEKKPTTVKMKVECGAEPKADRLQMLVVEPRVIENRAGFVWIGLTPKHYENLSVNMSAIKSQVGQKKAIIKFYRKCIKSHNNQ